MFTLDMLAALVVAAVGIFYPIVTRLMLNELIPEKKYRQIIIFGTVLLVLYIIRMLLNYFIQYQGHVVGVKMQAQMRSEMFDHLEKLSKAEGVISVSGKGLMIGIETKKDASAVIAKCQENGVLPIKAKSKVRLLPPLNITMEQLSHALDVIIDACAE